MTSFLKTEPGLDAYWRAIVLFGETGSDGKLFVDHTEGSIAPSLLGLSVEQVQNWTTPDVRPGRQREAYANCLFRRAYGACGALLRQKEAARHAHARGDSSSRNGRPARDTAPSGSRVNASSSSP